MLKIYGSLYYIDFEVLDRFLEIEGADFPNNIQETKRIIDIYNETGQLVSKEVIQNDNIKPKEINGVRFDIIRGFIDDLATATDGASGDVDVTLGSRNLTKLSTRFKLAFNTLRFYNILKELD